jgi:hypothetical protein
MNMLDDDRQKYGLGSIVKGLTKGSKGAKGAKDIDDIIGSMSKKELKNLSPLEKEQLLDMQIERYGVDAFKGDAKDIDSILKNMSPEEMAGLSDADIDMLLDMEMKAARKKKAEGGSLLEEDMTTHMMPDGTEMPGATHEAPEEDMAPDGEMEDEYLDFILEEALSEEEQSFLMEQLQTNTQLAMIFDKVIDVAQEFAGSGPVEGPGSGVSDSIPARLSDGEFVFTAEAVEEIGADNLMAMMKEAEAAVAERQGLAEGGMPEEEETVTMEVQKQKEPNVQIAKATVNNTRGLLDEDEISKGIKSKMMLDPLQKHVRS